MNFEIALPFEKLYNARYFNSTATNFSKHNKNLEGKEDFVIIEPVCNDKMAKAYQDINNILQENLPGP